MELSAKMERALVECYVEKTRSPLEPPPPESLTYKQGCGGSWFCPGCGIRATEESPWDVRCPSCRKSMFEFLRPLVELHPHR
jgi:hypothetical protein